MSRSERHHSGKEVKSHDKEGQGDSDVAILVSLFEDDEAPGKQDTPAEEEPKAPAKVYTYEEVRAILAEKSRTGFRAEVKALLTKHGVTQLSDVKEPDVFAAIVAEAEGIGVG